MSSLAISTQECKLNSCDSDRGKAPPPPLGATFESLNTLCSWSGLTRHAIGRIIKGLPEGFTKWGKSAKGQWIMLVRTDADERFCRYAQPEHLPARLRDFTEAQRKKALWRLGIVHGWNEARANAIRSGQTNEHGQAAYMATLEGRKLSASTIRRWCKVWRKKGLQGLLEMGRNGDKGEPAEDPFLKEATRLYLLPNALNISVVFDIAAAKAREQGWRLWCRRKVYYHLQSIPPSLRTLRRDGPEAFQNLHEPYLNRDYSLIKTNELWVTDHHQFDVIVKVSELIDYSTGECIPVYARPWLTSFQDMRSRKIVGWVIPAADPNGTAILIALDMGCETHGCPENIYTDNGADYMSRVLTGQTKAMRWKNKKVHVVHDLQELGGIYAAIGAKHITCLPFNAKAKPLERTHRTIEDRFSRLFDTYCGRSTEEKPERLAEMLERGKAPTLEDFIAQFGAWLENDYHNRVHTGDAMGCTPNEAFTANLSTKRTASPEMLEVLLQPKIGPLKVGRNGVVFKGVWYGQLDLGAYFGQRVYIRTSDQVGRVSVWDERDVFLCFVSSNARISPLATREDLDSAIKAKSRASKALKGVREAQVRLMENLPDALNRAAALRMRDRRPSEPPDPPNISPIRSDLEGQMKRLQEAREPLRLAAGAESLSAAGDLDRGSNRFQYIPQKLDAEGDSEPVGFTYKPARVMSMVDLMGITDE